VLGHVDLSLSVAILTSMFLARLLQPVQVLERVLLQLEQVLVRLQLEPESQLLLHLVVLQHSLEFVLQLQNQELPGCSIDLQLGQRQLGWLEQQQVIARQILLAPAQGQLQQQGYLSCSR
jgi:hypothetical protein